jgi:hypothetical protein
MNLLSCLEIAIHKIQVISHSVGVAMHDSRDALQPDKLTSDRDQNKNILGLEGVNTNVFYSVLKHSIF